MQLGYLYWHFSLHITILLFVQQKLFSPTEAEQPLADVHSSKRGENERRGVHAWHDYYAGYAEQFVDDVLGQIAHRGDLILDPWNGSGTTTLVSQRKGLGSLGIEINPVMSHHARAKDLRLAQAEGLPGAIENLIDSAQQRAGSVSVDLDNKLSEVFDEESLDALVALKKEILQREYETLKPYFAPITYGEDLAEENGYSSAKSFFLSALFQTLREVGNSGNGSNPTWTKLQESDADVGPDLIFCTFERRAHEMIDDLDTAKRGASDLTDFGVLTADSKKLPLRDERFDIVLTSPPYCTRIDYAVSTKPELLLIGADEETFDTFRRTVMGAPVVVDKGISHDDLWGSTCLNLLDDIENHESKASDTYYITLYEQYFRDAAQSLREIERVLKPGGLAAIVLQTSFYKEIEVPLSEIYMEMGRNLGLRPGLGKREVVKQHMAHINNKSQEYKKNKVYYEDVVLLEKPNPDL